MKYVLIFFLAVFLVICLSSRLFMPGLHRFRINVTKENVTTLGHEGVSQQGKSNSHFPLSSNNLFSNRKVWELSKAPKFCHELLKNPVPGEICPRNRDTAKCPGGKVAMFSRHFQDYYFYTKHFSRLRRRGVYLDIATNDAVRMSNTYFMDACMGWEGICVEANPKFFESIQKYRSCKLIPTCVTEKDGENVTFLLGGGLGGIDSTNKNMEVWNKAGFQPEPINMTCTNMDKVTSTYGVRYVDFMSLDVEGHELNVLKGFNWETIEIKVITVETSRKTLPGVTNFLEGRGFVRHFVDWERVRSGRLGQDAVFLYKGVSFGTPE